MRWWLLLAGAFVAESLRLALLARLPASPDPLLGMVVLVALVRRPPAGAAVGLGLGLMRDFLYGSTPGVEALPLAVIGWAVGSLGRSIYREAALTQALMILGGGLVRAALVFLILAPDAPSGLLSYLLRSTLPSAVLSAILIPALYHYFHPERRLKRQLYEKRLLLEQQ